MDRLLRIVERGACNGKRKHQFLLRGLTFNPELSFLLLSGQRDAMVRRGINDALILWRLRAKHSSGSIDLIRTNQVFVAIF